MEILRKIYEEKRINWVEALPKTLDRYHDVPNLSGLSPYQIVFGRHRPLVNVPYTPVSQCEDARDFFARMKEIDLAVSQKMEELHAGWRLKWRLNSRVPWFFMWETWFGIVGPKGVVTNLILAGCLKRW